MSKVALTIWTDDSRKRAAAWCHRLPIGALVTFQEDVRSVEQNAALWPLLTDIARQVQIDGQKDSPEVWKGRFMHALGHDAGFTRSLDGKTMIPLGYRSSKLTKEQFSDLLELIHAYAAEKGVKLSKEAA